MGPASHLRWIANPEFARGHETLATVSAMVSSGGRIFAIVDEGPTSSVNLPPRWRLVARDAFSGVLLWKRDIATWEDQLSPFRDGPNQLPRRLVAVGETVYATLSYDGPVTALSAATGETQRVFQETRRAEEIVVDGTRLVAVVSGNDRTRAGADERRGEENAGGHGKAVVAVNTETGQLLWRRQDPDTANLLVLTVAVDGRRVFYQNESHVVCLDLESGQVRWRADLLGALQRPNWSSPTLVVAEDVVLVADRRPERLEESEKGNREMMRKRTSHGGMPAEVVALDVDHGKRLWNAPTRDNFHVPPDLFVIGQEVWTSELAWGEDAGFSVVRDLHTGKVTRRIATDQTVGGHHRCYRNKATEDYVLLGRRNIEFLDVASESFQVDPFVRGGCSYGVMPANGMIYVPPHSCACSMDIKLSGMLALAPAERRDGPPETKSVAERRQRGPAYARALALWESDPPRRLDDWATYRSNPRRTGSTPHALPLPLAPGWSRRVGGRLSAPVVADGRIFVADVDTHRVLALDAATGTLAWTFTADARIDSPPTIDGPLAIFGSADGWVYAVLAETGELAWRFHASGSSPWMIMHDQLESSRPVHGSILACSGELFCAAGRSTYLDGGIRLCKLDARTGKLLAERVLDARADGRDAGERVLPDVLACDGDTLFMRGARYRRDDLSDAPPTKHLWSWTGMLDDTWWHRAFWMYGTEYQGGWSGWWVSGNRHPAGRLLVMRGDAIFGFGRSHYPSGNTGQWNSGEYYRLFATNADFEEIDPLDPSGKSYRRGNGPERSVVGCRWSEETDFAARALTLAGETLFAAGPLGPTHVDLDAMRGIRGVVLRAYDIENGQPMAEYELDAVPVHDAIAVAGSRLVVSLSDGSVACLQAVSEKPAD